MEQNNKNDRVRIVRRLSKWLAKADSISQDAARMKRDGVTVPDGWEFDYDQFFELVGNLRKYVYNAIGSSVSK